MKPGRNQSTRRKKTPANKLPKKRKRARKAVAAKNAPGSFGRTPRELHIIKELAKTLSARELVELRRAISQVETRDAKRRTFHRIAENHGVSSGDLEIALNLRLEKRVHRKRPSSR